MVDASTRFARFVQMSGVVLVEFPPSFFFGFLNPKPYIRKAHGFFWIGFGTPLVKTHILKRYARRLRPVRRPRRTSRDDTLSREDVGGVHGGDKPGESEDANDDGE